MNTVSLVRPVTVTSCDEVAQGVRRLRFTATDGLELPSWSPGAHIDVILPSGLVRQYSLCGSPDDRLTYDIAVLREADGRGGSAEVHDVLAPGDEIRISGPRNRFPLEDAASYLFVAGGIGITPILTMVEEAARLGREWRLVYGGRTRNSMAFLDRLGNHGDRVSVLPQDEFGLLDLAGLVRPSPGTQVYCCGPEPLLRAVESHCDTTWPPGSLHVERFMASSPTVPLPGEAGSFEVQLGEGGPVLDVPADKSVLHTVLDAGVDALYSCEEGTCGSCETQVLAGDPEHRDTLLSEASRQQGSMLICVSRCIGRRLVLDLEPPDDLVLRNESSA